jgi:Zn-dependent metalloprotease
MRRAIVVLAAGLAMALPALTSAASQFTDRYPNAKVHLRAGSNLPSLVTDLAVPVSAQDPQAAVEQFVTDNADFFGFTPSLGSLERIRPVTGGKATVYRFAQRHLGLAVPGADIAVSVNEQSRIYMVGNGLESIGLVPTDFSTTESAAVTAAIAQVQPQLWSGQPKSVRRVLARIDGDRRAAWEVELVTSRPLGEWHVFVDPHSGAVLRVANYLRNVQGYAYPDCPEAGTYQSVTLPDLTSTTNLTGTYATMYSDCTPNSTMGGPGDCAAADKKAKPTNGDYLITPNEGSAADAFAEVHTYYHINQIHSWYKAANFNALDLQMPIAVNYTQDPNQACNAGYMGNGILVGLCDLSQLGLSGWVNFAYDSLSVMHEYSHGAVDHSAGFIMYDVDDWGLVEQQGGLNEGFADYFAAVVLGDPQVGRHVGPKAGIGPYLRTLEDFRACPADIAGEVHDDGQMWGSANWEAFIATSSDVNVPHAVLQGLIGLSSRPTFQDAANGVIAASGSFPSTVHDALLAAYTAHGLLGCGRGVSVPNGSVLKGMVQNPMMLGLSGSTGPFPWQYVVSVPAGATALNLAITATNDSGSNAVSSLRVFVNPNSHVVYKTSGSTAQYNSAGDYYILPVGYSFGYSYYDYSFSITVNYLGGSSPDGGVPGPDASTPPTPDASVPGPDASVLPGQDAATPGPDGAVLPGQDAAAPGPDATVIPPGPDASVVPPGPDASLPADIDASTVPPGPDAQTVMSDATVGPGLDGSAQPGPDASASKKDTGVVSAADTGGGTSGSSGCSCGLGGGAGGNVGLLAGIALFGMAISRRRRS